MKFSALSVLLDSHTLLTLTNTTSFCSFTFTSIDPDDPSRQFSFLLRADDMNAYQVEDCKPQIDNETTEALLREVDRTDDLQSFIIGMRKAFVATLN